MADRLADQFLTIDSRLRVRRVYNALDRRTIQILNRPHETSPEMVAAFVGHVSHAKGAVDLVHAAALVKAARGNSMRIYLAGEVIANDSNIGARLGHPGERDARIAARALGVESICEFMGPISRERACQLLNWASVFVLPSYSEGFSIAMLEAMEAGLPIITTPVGANPEILDGGIHCLFVAPGDRPGLAAALISICDEPAIRQRMGQANRQLVAKRFLPEHFAQQVNLVIAELTNPVIAQPPIHQHI